MDLDIWAHSVVEVDQDILVRLEGWSNFYMIEIKLILRMGSR